jgi:predicted metal-binding membrane protein
MFMMARMSGLDVLGRPVGMNMMPMATFGALFPMWATMMAAMMLPTMIPTLRNYEALMASADGTRAGWIGVLLGYLVVWVGFAALIAVVQVALVAGGLIDTLGIAASGFFAAALLIVVGAFQFTRAKEICHGVCHSPMSYFLGHWKTGFSGGFRMGLGLGAFCVGCCWGFMVLGFVGGVMSLLWMGLATLFMIFEKLPQVGHHLTKPAGAVLILAGVAVAIASF